MHGGDASPILVTIVAAVAIGVLLIAVARRLGLPSIVMLLAGGVALGPVGAGVVQPASLGDGLDVLVKVLVGVVLFEGGLTLDLAGYRTAGRTIGRMLSVGVITTWLTTAVAIRLVTGYDFVISIIAASLVIVTGPTVIGPLLKRVRVTERLHHALQWEGVLIDPIGVFIAVLCFEALALDYRQLALLRLLLRAATGLAIGAAGGFAIHRALRHRIIPEEMAGVGTLASAILLFGLADVLAPESGLLTVAAAGLVLGVLKPAQLDSIRQFKGEVTELCLGMLFIVLSARLSVEQFVSFGIEGIVLVAVVMMVVRPLSIALSTWGGDWSWRERIFLSWVAPRGIVAASMASLMAIELEALGVARPRFVESFTYAVIVGTILLQASTAGVLARALGLLREVPRGWLVVGAHAFAREVAQQLVARGVTPVLLVDLNRSYVRTVLRHGLVAVVADARNVDDLSRRVELSGIGQLLALTANEDLNVVVCRNWQSVLHRERVFRWHSTAEPEVDAELGTGVWTGLPSPMVIASELEHGEARLLWSDTLESEPRRPRHRLLVLSNERVHIERDAPSVLQNGTEEGPLELLLEREASYLVRSLHAELAFELDAATRSALLRELMSRAARVLGELPVDKLVDDLLERERTFPASLGDGVAVPHVFVDGLDRQYSVVARLQRPLDWQAPDGEPVRLVLLLLSPPGDHDRHLALLADIARQLGSPAVRKRLLSVEPDQMLDVLRDAHVR